MISFSLQTAITFMAAGCTLQQKIWFQSKHNLKLIYLLSTVLRLFIGCGFSFPELFIFKFSIRFWSRSFDIVIIQPMDRRSPEKSRTVKGNSNRVWSLRMDNGFVLTAKKTHFQWNISSRMSLCRTRESFINTNIVGRRANRFLETLL